MGSVPTLISLSVFLRERQIGMAVPRHAFRILAEQARLQTWSAALTADRQAHDGKSRLFLLFLESGNHKIGGASASCSERYFLR